MGLWSFGRSRQNGSSWLQAGMMADVADVPLYDPEADVQEPIEMAAPPVLDAARNNPGQQLGPARPHRDFRASAR
jgi:hypothetical protein